MTAENLRCHLPAGANQGTSNIEGQEHRVVRREGLLQEVRDAEGNLVLDREGNPTLRPRGKFFKADSF